MKADLLREISEQFLLPFFSGARLEPHSIPSTKRAERVAHEGAFSIKFKVNPLDRYRLVLSRPQAFTFSGERIVTEIDVVRAFCDVLASMESELAGPLKADLLSTFQRRVVARALRNSISEPTILEGIDQLARWGNRLYEGAPISASLGFCKTASGHKPEFSEVNECDFSAVLSNGYDTLTVFDYEGGLVGHESLDGLTDFLPYAPMRQSAIAGWTKRPSDRVSLSLNRLGEILIFRKAELIFARRSGRWHYLTHEPVISQMDVPRDRALRAAIYETCLDASFARTGACIGVVTVKSGGQWRRIVAEGDDLLGGNSVKTKALRKVIAGKNFAKLDRRTRQEIVAIDGATILAHDGSILAIGAILRVPGGSEGGGRLAAAKEVAKLGLGIKVSQDGGITGFRANRTAPVFKIM